MSITVTFDDNQKAFLNQYVSKISVTPITQDGAAIFNMATSILQVLNAVAPAPSDVANDSEAEAPVAPKPRKKK